MKNFILILTLTIFFGCSKEDPEEKEYNFAIQLRSTCVNTTESEYSQFYCVTEETYNRIMVKSQKDTSPCTTISFQTVTGETVNGIYGGSSAGNSGGDCSTEGNTSDNQSENTGENF